MHLSLLTTLALTTLGQAGSLRSLQCAYSFDLDRASHPNWMESVPGQYQLGALSIPGTHNSMTYSMYFDEDRQCQNTPLSSQLNAGIRYLDITGRTQRGSDADPDRNIIQVYHKNVDTGNSLDSVLGDIFNFLQANPSEAIIMRLEKDNDAPSDAPIFEDVLEEYLFYDTEMGQRARDYLYRTNGRNGYELPTLGDLRGKLLILQDFYTKKRGLFGVPWDSSKISVVDWKLTFAGFGKDKKWSSISDGITAAEKEKKNKLHVTHVSLSHGPPPYKGAGGPRSGMNDRLGNYLGYDNAKRVGILVMDFPGEVLVDQIIGLNSALSS
ncbi:hypothetical protein BROUX41_005825 [Berkeleyomyces rouxiae]|uniref:uncharacterized protein n=1 Tax=Berkeleyomyces rouxiae TaxID=2035830 RepID=UPI003B7BC9AF